MSVYDDCRLWEQRYGSSAKHLSKTKAKRTRKLYLTDDSIYTGNNISLQALGQLATEWAGSDLEPGRFAHRMKLMERVNHFTLHGQQRSNNRQQFNTFRDKKLSLTQTRQVIIIILYS